jgi:hypothetical protein
MLGLAKAKFEVSKCIEHTFFSSTHKKTFRTLPNPTPQLFFHPLTFPRLPQVLGKNQKHWKQIGNDYFNI